MRKLIFAMLTALLLTVASNSFAQIFIAFDGVEGESTAKGFTNAIQIESFSWGASNPSSQGATTGARTGKLKTEEIVFTKLRGSASNTLQMAVFSGKHFPKAEGRFSRSAADAAKGNHYLTITFEDVVISSWQISGSGSEKPMESISFNFARMKFEEIVGTNPDGSSKKVTGGWDIMKNMQIK